jgi:hypothetical protein
VSARLRVNTDSVDVQDIAPEPITLSAENWSTFIPLFDPDESMTEIFGEWAAQ